jgi:hypothetical protein
MKIVSKSMRRHVTISVDCRYGSTYTKVSRTCVVTHGIEWSPMRQLVIYCARGSARRKGYEFGGSHRIPKGGSSVRCRGISQREYHCDTTGAGSRTRRELPTCAREMWSEHWTPPAQSATASPLGQRQPIKSQQQPPGSNALAADTCAPLDPLLALSSSLLLPHSLRGNIPLASPRSVPLYSL